MSLLLPYDTEFISEMTTSFMNASGLPFDLLNDTNAGCDQGYTDLHNCNTK